MFFEGSFPKKRMRRLRTDDYMRRLVQETSLKACDLIYPVFVVDKDESYEDIVGMPGVFRLGRQELCKVASLCLERKIPAIALFPCVDGSLKTPGAEEAYNVDGFLPKTIKLLKEHTPSLGVIADVALDPYTSHGQDGLLDPEKNTILNDETVQVLVKQALCYAESGVDIIAPSDMMDGRVGAIRSALDEANFSQVKILSYAAKYASSFYGPFRHAVGSAPNLQGQDKKTYQMDPANSNEALHEVYQDIKEGADMVMVKPASFYSDIIWQVKNKFAVPTFAYQVSGEYAMLKAASEKGLIDEKSSVLESLLSLKRSGCDAILTYYALQAAEWIL